MAAAARSGFESRGKEERVCRALTFANPRGRHDREAIGQSRYGQPGSKIVVDLDRPVRTLSMCMAFSHKSMRSGQLRRMRALNHGPGDGLAK